MDSLSDAYVTLRNGKRAIEVNNSGGSGDQSSEVINKWGENVDIDTLDVNQIIWPIKATVQAYLFIDSPIQLYLKSTSINDILGGTGARTVKVFFQDNNGHFAEVTLDMDGQDNVELPTTSYGSFRMKVESSGSINKNAGQIQIVDGSNNIYSTIEIGESQTQIAVQRVPNNRRARIFFHQCKYGRTGSSNDAFMRLRIRKVDGTIVTKWDPVITTILPVDQKEYFKGGIDVNPGEWVYWECILVSANNTPINASFDIEFFEL